MDRLTTQQKSIHPVMYRLYRKRTNVNRESKWTTTALTQLCRTGSMDDCRIQQRPPSASFSSCILLPTSFFVIRFPYSLSPTSSRAQHNRVSWKLPATLSEIHHNNIKAALVNRERYLKLLVDGDIDKASQSQWEFRLSYCTGC
jgi:hypothetical protein